MKYLIAIVFLLIHTNSFAQAEARVAIGLNSNEVNIGDKIFATIQLQFDKNKYDLHFPHINTESWQPITVLQAGAIDTLQNGNIITMKQVLSIACYDTGIVTIPPIVSVGQSLEQSAVVQISSDSTKIHIQGVLIDKNGDIKDIVKTNTKDEQLKTYAAIAILVASILAVFFILYKKKKNKFVTKPKTALEELSIIQNFTINNQLQAKEGFSKLVTITKNYFAANWQIPLLDKPSAEAIQLLQNNVHASTFIGNLKNIFLQADAIKFAKQTATQQQYTEAWQQCFSCITTLEKTRLQLIEKQKNIQKATTQFKTNKKKNQ